MSCCALPIPSTDYYYLVIMGPSVNQVLLYQENLNYAKVLKNLSTQSAAVQSAQCSRLALLSN